MKKYNLTFIVNVSGLIVSSMGILACLVFQRYGLFFFFLFTLILFIYYLNKVNKEAYNEVSKLIDSIKFSEFNVTFKHLQHKGLFPELAEKMEDTIVAFNGKTYQKEAELHFYENLLRQIDTAIMVVNADKQVQWINQAALNIVSKYPHHLQDLQSVSPDLPIVLDKLKPKEVKTIQIKNNEADYKLAVTVVLFNTRGEEMKVISLKNIQSVLDENESEAWKKLIRILTHEMMNSITPIISLSETFSEMDTDSVEPDMMNKAMQTIHRRSKGLVQFVGNYQKLTRIPEPIFTLFPVESIMEDISRLLKAQHIKFRYIIYQNDILLYADRSQIEQVLINLVKNAWEACCEKETPKILVEITKDEYQRPVITITDNGQGIIKEVLDKIFIPFFTTKKEGSGIGLSICRQIINAHGGNISVTSQPDEGTVFTIKM